VAAGTRCAPRDCPAGGGASAPRRPQPTPRTQRRDRRCAPACFVFFRPGDGRVECAPSMTSPFRARQHHRHQPTRAGSSSTLAGWRCRATAHREADNRPGLRPGCERSGGPSADLILADAPIRSTGTWRCPGCARRRCPSYRLERSCASCPNSCVRHRRQHQAYTGRNVGRQTTSTPPWPAFRDGVIPADSAGAG